MSNQKVNLEMIEAVRILRDKECSVADMCLKLKKNRTTVIKYLADVYRQEEEHSPYLRLRLKENNAARFHKLHALAYDKFEQLLACGEFKAAVEFFREAKLCLKEAATIEGSYETISSVNHNVTVKTAPSTNTHEDILTEFKPIPLPEPEKEFIDVEIIERTDEESTQEA
jgi:hypothetical protein